MTTTTILQLSQEKSGLKGALSPKQSIMISSSGGGKTIKQAQVKSCSEGLWLVLLPGKVKKIIKTGKVLDNHTERIWSLASEIFHDTATQPGSREPESRTSLVRREGTWRMK